MRYLPALLLAITINQVFAQAPFAGRVTYTLHSSKEKNDAELTAWFGSNSIKMQFSEKGKSSSTETILIHLDSGRLYLLDTVAKNYKLTLLKKRGKLPELSSKTIAGYKTSPLQSEPSALGNILGTIFSNTVFYTADDLYFQIPDEYRANPELSIVQNGKVVLGADITMESGIYDLPEDRKDSMASEKNNITVRATQVVAGQMAESLFKIPIDYKMREAYSYNSDSTLMFDSMAVAAVDSMQMEPAKPDRNKKPAKKNPATKKAKESAIRRKNQ